MKIVVGGHLNQDDKLEIIKSIDPKIECEIMDDMTATIAVKSGKYDYYFGSCQTGAGGALAMPLAILGAAKCVSVAGPSFILAEEIIKEKIKEGKIAFGFVPEAAEAIIPILIRGLKED